MVGGRLSRLLGALGKPPEEMAANLEGKVGKRVSGLKWFDGGMIVNLRNGERVVVWPSLIDCKDPPYNPLASRKTKGTAAD